jgi:hypothetical protein
VYEGVTVPDKANIVFIDAEGAYVSFKRVNFDQTLVDVLANDQIYFEVIAQDATTKIAYQLTPNASNSDAYVVSSVYIVDQSLLAIGFVPDDATVSTFFSNIVPSAGASVKLVDKFGIERTSGGIYKDDILVVTSKDGTVEKSYKISLAEQNPDHLMQITSDVYPIDQTNLIITVKEPFGFTIGGLKANLIPSENSRIFIINYEDKIKPDDGLIDRRDQIVLVYGDSVARMTYKMDYERITTSTERMDKGAITLYPNPSSGLIHFEGLTTESIISIYNASGILLKQQKVLNDIESVSIENQPNGLYFITISEGNIRIGSYKVIKK